MLITSAQSNSLTRNQSPRNVFCSRWARDQTHLLPTRNKTFFLSSLGRHGGDFPFTPALISFKKPPFNMWLLISLSPTYNFSQTRTGSITSCQSASRSVMPRVTLPPTPASSTDITGQKGAQHLSSLEMSFLLPPPAIAAKGNNKNSASTLHSQSTITSADFSLPPPPTRSRKIIQMKPKPKQIEDSGSPPNPKPAYKTAGKKAASSTASTPASKKQPSLTSAAGKKMARKTAHSVIERRRRSKMNEEFGVLKDLIPACKDQDMHKLAILQV